MFSTRQVMGAVRSEHPWVLVPYPSIVRRGWIPVFTGMTVGMSCHGRDYPPCYLTSLLMLGPSGWTGLGQFASQLQKLPFQMVKPWGAGASSP